MNLIEKVLMAHNRLIYIPLGGAGEVGMNMYVYGFGPVGLERYIIVDLGVTFPDMEHSPGVNLILPDIRWIEERKDRLDGIFITHAHEDHVGALGHLFSRLDAPIFARKFTAHIAKLKMEEHGQDINKINIVDEMPSQVSLGSFKVGFMPVSHSIPEASALIIDTPEGRIVHSGDFKLDETPGVGDSFNREAWSSLGPVKTLVCDSTNIFVHHRGGSERSVSSPLKKLIKSAGGMVIATTFASNIARVKTLADAGISSGRSVVLLGRAMKRMVKAALETGVLSDFPATISAQEAQSFSRAKLLLLVTGSQGESRAASSQLSRGKYQGLSLKKGDIFVFSSKTIPGNEISVGRIVNNLSEMGVDVVDDSMGDFHVSGHANRPDLVEFHQLIKPDNIIPMHGEHRMMREHCKVAQGGGFRTILATNGSAVCLSGKAHEVIDQIDTGRLYLDGLIYSRATDGVIKDRIRLALNGHVTIGILIDEDDAPLEDSWCELKGLPERGTSMEYLNDIIEGSINQSLQLMDPKTLVDDSKVEEQLRKIVRQISMSEIGKKPEVTILVSRLA